MVLDLRSKRTPCTGCRSTVCRDGSGKCRTCSERGEPSRRGGGSWLELEDKDERAERFRAKGVRRGAARMKPPVCKLGQAGWPAMRGKPRGGHTGEGPSANLTDGPRSPPQPVIPRSSAYPFPLFTRAIPSDVLTRPMSSPQPLSTAPAQPDPKPAPDPAAGETPVGSSPALITSSTTEPVSNSPVSQAVISVNFDSSIDSTESADGRLGLVAG